MTSPTMMRVEESLNNEPSHRFDRTKFSEKMHSFDNLIGVGAHNSNGSIPTCDGNENDSCEILSLDDSIAESGTHLGKKAPSPSHAGALEQTLKLSPMKRVKVPAEAKSPKSGTGRRGLGLARFIKGENQVSPGHDKRSSMPDLEPIWQYSDIMSVGAASKVGDAKSVYTYHPSSGNSVTTSDRLWDRATKNIAASRPVSQRSLSIGPAAFKQETSAGEKSQPMKRSISLNPTQISSHNDMGKVPTIPPKSPRRKLKKEPKGNISASDHAPVKAPSKMGSILVPPSPKDTKSRLSLPTKASHSVLNSKNFTGITIMGPTTSQEEMLKSPKAKKKNVKKQIREGEPESPNDKKPKIKKVKNKSKSESLIVVANIDVLLSTSSRTEEESKSSEKGKKKRSKSLSRVSLYDHESSDLAKRDHLKRRGSKREHHVSYRGDNQSVSSSPKPNRSSSTASLTVGPKRMSRRQFLKKMDSESVISAPAGISSMSTGGCTSLSPRPGTSSKQLPRRGDSRRNLLCSSLQPPNLNHHTSPQDVVQNGRGETGTSPKMKTSSHGGVSSAKAARRRYSSDPEGRVALFKRIESVNSFFGKGLGEIGSAYPSTRSLMVEDDGVDDTHKKVGSIRRKGKKSDKKPSREKS